MLVDIETEAEMWNSYLDGRCKVKETVGGIKELVALYLEKTKHITPPLPMMVALCTQLNLCQEE